MFRAKEDPIWPACWARARRKTSAADRVARLAGRPKVHLRAYDFRPFIKTGAVAPWRSGAHARSDMVVEVPVGAAARFLGVGSFVLVDGAIGPWFLDGFRDLAARVHYVVLRPDPDEAFWRCRERGGGTLSAPGPVLTMYLRFDDPGAPVPTACP